MLATAPSGYIPDPSGAHRDARCRAHPLDPLQEGNADMPCSSPLEGQCFGLTRGNASRVDRDRRQERPPLRLQGTDPHGPGIRLRHAWWGLKTIVGLDRSRKINGKTENETRFYLISQTMNAILLGLVLRGHYSGIMPGLFFGNWAMTPGSKLNVAATISGGECASQSENEISS